jgi:peptidoglycan/LPS O-acetylase OafA/YrhL
LLQKTRIHYLDSSRGIAALIVLLAHFQYALSPIAKDCWVFKSPLAVFFDGQVAVLYFFVLSGFVLTRSMKNNAGLDFKSYYRFGLKRILRIYPAFIFAFILTYFALIFIGPVNDNPWLSSFWQNPLPDFFGLIKQMLLVKRVPNDPLLRILPHDWTLSIEMAVSLLLPALALLAEVNRYVMILVVYLSVKLLGLDPFVFDFCMGIFLAKEIEHRTINRGKLVLLICSVVLICIGYLFPEPVSISDHFLIHTQTWGLCCLLILLLWSEKFQRLLSWRPFTLLGKISYSFYLLHLVILLILIKLLPEINSIAFLIIFILSTILFSVISFFLIEKPFILKGHALTPQEEN